MGYFGDGFENLKYILAVYEKVKSFSIRMLISGQITQSLSNMILSE